mgnify:FL=1
MKAVQFFKLVEELRKYQKEYFKTRSKEALQQSKALEKRVDDEILRVNEIMKKKNP